MSLVGRYVESGIAWSRLQAVRRGAASGGLVTSTLIATLRAGEIDGALVATCKGIKPQWMIARDQDELVKASGSVYTLFPHNTGLRLLLRAEERYAVVGLPCHLRGLARMASAYPELRDKVALKIGLFCKHALSLRGLLFLLKSIGVETNCIESIRFRAKALGTTGLHVKTKDKEIFIPLSKYWPVLSLLSTPQACLDCPDFASEKADVSVGDAWGLRGAGSEGFSLYLIRSREGRKALKLTADMGLIEAHVVSKKLLRYLLRHQGLMLLAKRRRGVMPRLYLLALRMSSKVFSRGLLPYFLVKSSLKPLEVVI
jgi:coenzyme F420 hydrogenase subunit beta